MATVARQQVIDMIEGPVRRRVLVTVAPGERVALFHPRTHRWSDHFAWSADFARIEGKTPLGRATIEVLHFNRPGVVNLRRVLAAGGLHPPSEI